MLKATSICKWRPPVIGFAGRPACSAVVTFNQTVIYYSEISRSCSCTHASRVQNWFSARCAKTRRDSQLWQHTWRMRNQDQRVQNFPDPPHHLWLLRKHRSFIGAFYTSAPDIFEEGSGFQRDSTPDVLFIQVEEIRRFSCHQSPLNGKYLALSEPADLQGIRLVFVCNSWKSLLPQQRTD